MELEQIIEQASMQLPTNWTIRIDIECGSVDVQVLRPDRTEVGIGDNDWDIAETVRNAMKFVRDEKEAESKSACVEPAYPSFSQYGGGGSILNAHTTPNNITSECYVHGVEEQEVRDLISSGYEVIILNGAIKAAQKHRMDQR